MSFFIQQNKVLKLDPYSRSSWWENGPGCKETLNKTAPIPIVEKVTDCWFDYRQVEIFQASLQGILAVRNMYFKLIKFIIIFYCIDIWNGDRILFKSNVP